MLVEGSSLATLIEAENRILNLLRLEPEVNQKIISIISRARNECFTIRFLLEHDNAFAMKYRSSDATFVYIAHSPPSAEFHQKLTNMYSAAQGSISSFVGLNYKFVKRDMLLMLYSPNSPKEHFSPSSPAQISIADPLLDENDVFDLLHQFALQFNDESLAKRSFNENFFQNGTMLLAKVHDKAAGCIYLTRAENGIRRMTYLFVKPEFRSLKIGKLLIREALNECSEGVKIILFVRKSNEIAFRLYQNAGFEVLCGYQERQIK
jgi:GNAT superfamily N-acetyltransferase